MKKKQSKNTVGESMKKLKNIREYHTPIERSLIEEHTIELITETEEAPKNFYDVLLGGQNVGIIIERTFLLSLDKRPKALIRSIFPKKFLQACHDKLEDIEGHVDVQFHAVKIKKEISLSWPTSEEAEMLQLIGDTQVIIEKQFILDKQEQIIRYEEEISDPEFYIFEE
jgi:DNA-binding GntR family transcriptional regulator